MNSAEVRKIGDFEIVEVSETSFLSGTLDTRYKAVLTYGEVSKFLGEPLDIEKKLELLKFGRLADRSLYHRITDEFNLGYKKISKLLEGPLNDREKSELSKLNELLGNQEKLEFYLEKYVNPTMSFYKKYVLRLPRNPKTGNYRRVVLEKVK